LTRLRQNIFV